MPLYTTLNRYLLTFFIKGQCSSPYETTPLICSSNQLTGFNMLGKLAFN